MQGGQPAWKPSLSDNYYKISLYSCRDNYVKANFSLGKRKIVIDVKT